MILSVVMFGAGSVYAAQAQDGEDLHFSEVSSFFGTAADPMDHEESVRFSQASVTLNEGIRVNFLAEEGIFTNDGYRNPYVIFEFNGGKTRVETYCVEDGCYKFAFDKVAPHMLGMTIKATLYAEKDGVLYRGGTTQYSVKQYCTNKLKEDSGASDELKTLVVDLLNYGAAAQLFMDPTTPEEKLVNSDLADAQKALGTSGMPAMRSIKDADMDSVNGAEVTWKAVGLYLRDNVSFRFEFVPPADMTGLTAKVWDDYGHEWTCGPDCFAASKLAASDGGLCLYFSGFKAGRFRDAVYVAFYRGNTKVSSTLRYSVESYCYSKGIAENGNDQNAILLRNLAIALMKYGDSVARCANAGEH